MLLALDVGNTTTQLGLFSGRTLQHSFELRTRHHTTKDELGALVSNLFDQARVQRSEIKAAVLGCVVPALQPVMVAMLKSYFNVEPLVVGPGIKTGLNIRFSSPAEMGADRVANSVAAIELYGGPLIIVDFGTATTFCVLDENGSYLGGALAPGIETSTTALFERAAKLPWVELEIPDSVIGKNTAHSLKSGIIYGFAGLVDGIVARIKSEWQRDCLVIATGSLAPLMKRVCLSLSVVDPRLTLKGLELIYHRNRG